VEGVDLSFATYYRGAVSIVLQLIYMKANDIQYSELVAFQSPFGRNGEADVSTNSRIRNTVSHTGESHFTG
jgi:hypothetical protein